MSTGDQDLVKKTEKNAEEKVGAQLYWNLFLAYCTSVVLSVMSPDKGKEGKRKKVSQTMNGSITCACHLISSSLFRLMERI